MEKRVTPIYLDNSMTTRPSVKAVSQMMPYLSDHWGHPSQPHKMGQELYPALAESYKSLYKLLGARDKDGFVFTSSGAEAINQVIQSAFYDITLSTGRNHFITSTINEAPAIMAIGRLEKQSCVGKMVEINAHGQVSASHIAEAVTPRTAVVSLDWANGLTGVINPVAEISTLCQERGIALHLDATHVLGKLFFELDDVGASYITFNGDHLHAPKGTGGLWIKENVKCAPLILGGIEQAGLRAGSFNIPGLVALGYAANELLEARDFVCTEVARLRNRLEEGIQEGFPDACIFHKDVERLPNVTAIGFPGISNEALLYALNRKNVFASIGGGSSQQIALLLTAAKVPDILANTALSFSLSRFTTEEEIERAIEQIVDTAQKLRTLSGALS